MCLICRGEDISTLTILDCSYCTVLTSLPELPAGLQNLWCDGCPSLTALPDLPAGLELFSCNGCAHGCQMVMNIIGKILESYD